MAETSELAALDSQLSAALADVGSTLTFEKAAPHDPAPVARELPVVALDALPEVEATVAEDEQRATPDTPATPEVTPRYVTADDLVKLQEHQAQQTQLLIQTILQAQQAKQAPPATQAPQERTLADAVMDAWLTGAKTPVEEWERAQHERQARAAQITEVEKFQQQKIHDLANTYTFLRDEAPWQETLQEMERLKQSQALRGLLPDDPRQQIQYQGKAVDLRLLAMAAHAMQGRVAGKEAGKTEATKQAEDTRRQLAPGVEGGTAPTTRGNTTPSLLLPSEMVQGEDALLNDPRMQKALADIGWGKDPRTQQKRVAEKLPVGVKQSLQRQYRQGNRVGVA